MKGFARVFRALLAAAAMAVVGGERDVAAQMTPVGSPFAVSTGLLLTPSPVVAMDTNGTFVAVWSTDIKVCSGNATIACTTNADCTPQPSAGTCTTGAGNFDIFAHRFDRTGSELGTEFAVNTITAGHQSNPSVAFVGTGGDFVIVWVGQDSNYGGIRGNIFDDSDTRLFPQDVVVNQTEQGDQRAPAVVGTNTGFIVAWEHFPIGASGEIRVQMFGSNGVAVGLERSAVTSSPSQPDLDAADDGSFVVVWTQVIGPGNSDIFARLFSSAGAPFPNAIAVNSTTPGAQGGPRVQVRRAPQGQPGDGEFVVAWNAGAQYLPNFQQFDAGGSKKPSGETAAAEPPPSGNPNPGFIDVALAADGSFATVYVSPSSNPVSLGVTEIAGLLLDDTAGVIDSNPGDANTNEFLVHDPADATNNQTTGTFPRIATDGAGLFVAVYGNNGRSAGPIATQSPPRAAARLFTTGTTTTTTTLPPAGPTCADPNGSGNITVSDALLALRASTGAGTCALCLCDINGSGTITTTDALLILRAATGIIVSFACPACP